MQENPIEKSENTVKALQERNLSAVPNRLTSDEAEALLNQYHPDYFQEDSEVVMFGANRGGKVPKELNRYLSGKSRVDITTEYRSFDCETDVLILGGGGAGVTAAIEAKRAGVSVMIATKLRLGDSNTVMAQGGMQAADGENDSLAAHFIDTFGGGHFQADRSLLSRLVGDGPKSVAWLKSLGVSFDCQPNGDMVLNHGGGTSRRRMHACRDYTGLEIMRTLRDEALDLGVTVLEYASAIELLTDLDGSVCGAILMQTGEQRLISVRAKAVVMATGGSGRLHYRGFPTTNHYGATGDGLVLSYRAGAKLLFPSSQQYHPTGVVSPPGLFGNLVTEKARSLGAMLLNRRGTPFVHPLEPRDVCSAAIIRECRNGLGVEIDNGVVGVWLDTPMIDLLHGSGTLEREIPSMLTMFASFGKDIRREPVLVYPTHHYQNGGIAVNENTEVIGVKHLFACGEVVGGIHGTNRLMGNSLLDTVVFGRIAGQAAARLARQTGFSAVGTLRHLKPCEEARRQMTSNQTPTPLILPDYTRHKIHK